jgi:hypothetical protein
MERGDALAPISVCIPVCNEGRTIAATIESVLYQRFDPGPPPEMEVLICANACTDNTVEEVRKIQKRHPGRVRMIETATKGKPNAWNVLRREAKHEYLFFVDGDVQVDARAFYHLHRMLRQRSDLILVAGQTVGLLRHCSLLTRLSLPSGENGVLPFSWQRTLCGRLIAFKKSAMSAAIRSAGFDDMPANTINNDRWIACVLDTAASKQNNIELERVLVGEVRNWAICREAPVYFVPHDWWSDKPMVRARTIHGHEQLRGIFPACYPAHPRPETGAARQGLLSRATSAIRLLRSEGAGYLVRDIMERIAEKRARRVVKLSKARASRIATDQWVRGERSKALSSLEDAVHGDASSGSGMLSNR